MANLKAMFGAIEFIEAHLQADIQVADMAEAVSFSLYHFCRTFNRIVHHTPYDYLMRRRLSESARDLLATDHKIIDIALDYRFNSPETYARAFKRLFEMQPSQWRKAGRSDDLRLMPRLSLAHLEHLNKGPYLKPVLVEKAAFSVIGLMSLLREEGAVFSELWRMFAEELAPLKERGDFYGLRWAGGRFYMAAAKIAADLPPGSALVGKTVPAGRYARFIHKGRYSHLSLSRDYIYHTWLPKSGYRLAWPVEIESYGPDFPRPAEEGETELEIYIPVAS